MAWDISSITQACPRLEHLHLDLPIHGMKLSSNFTVKSLAISHSGNPGRDFSSLTEDTLRGLLVRARPQSLELEVPLAQITVSICNLHLMPRTLPIKHLRFGSVDFLQARGIAELIGACANLETFRVVIQSDVWECPRGASLASTQLVSAIEVHHETLRECDVVRMSWTGRSSGSYGIGGCSVNMNFCRLDKIQQMALPEDP